jgi:hypothetical protein
MEFIQRGRQSLLQDDSYICWILDMKGQSLCKWRKIAFSRAKLVSSPQRTLIDGKGRHICYVHMFGLVDRVVFFFFNFFQ